MTELPPSQRQRIFDATFSGPTPTQWFNQGATDARAGKPQLSRNPDYARGFIMGLALVERDAEELRITTAGAVVEVDGVRL